MWLLLVLPTTCLLLLPLAFCGKKDRKTPSDSKNRSTPSSSSHTGCGKPKSKESIKPPSHLTGEVIEPIPAEKTQPSPVQPTPPQPSSKKNNDIEGEDEGDDTVDDAPSLRPSRPELPSEARIQKKSAPQNGELKVERTIESERTVREVRHSSLRKGQKKTLRREVVTALEKKPSVVGSKKRRQEARLQATQEQE